MPEVQHLGMVILVQITGIFTTPGNRSLIRHQKAAQGAQQTGFAAAVRALYLHDLTGMQGKAQAGKQTMIAATASKIADFQHEKEIQNKRRWIIYDGSSKTYRATQFHRHIKVFRDIPCEYQDRLHPLRSCQLR